jgi:hypothetical protein
MVRQRRGCMVKSVSITDARFRIGVGVAGVALVAGIAAVRFCGSVALPPKPPPPEIPSGTSSELLTRSSASPVMYQDFVTRDAAAAGVRAPTLDELSRKLPYRVDDARRVLEVGQPAIELAGVRLRAIRIDAGLALEIANATASDIAYTVASQPIPAAGCGGAPLRMFNAMTIRNNASEIRVECGWHDGIALAITRVETLEVSPLSAAYLDRLPPSMVGIEPRIARAHQGPETGDRCAFALPQSVRSGLERGEIGWRDLVDFYARHRCQTYRFPLNYRAFKTDGERSVPVVAAGM